LYARNLIAVFAGISNRPWAKPSTLITFDAACLNVALVLIVSTAAPGRLAVALGLK